MAVVRYRDENGDIVPLRVIKGENGDQMFVRFSAHSDGTDMSEVWDDLRDYMGIAFGVVAPTDKSAYQWVRVSHFPNSMRVDEDNNLHVKGEVTFGEEDFSPRAAKMVTGTIMGTGTNSITLELGFTPTILMLSYDYWYRDSYGTKRRGTNGSTVRYFGKGMSGIGSGSEFNLYDIEGATDGWAHLSNIEFTDNGCVVSMVFNGTGNPVSNNATVYSSDAWTTYKYTAVG